MAVLQTPPRVDMVCDFENEGGVTQPIGVAQKLYHGNSLTVFLFVLFFQGDKRFVGREGIPHERPDSRRNTEDTCRQLK